MTEDNQALDIIKEFAGAMGSRTVDKISNALGMMFPYAGLKKIAIDTYVESIKNSNLSPEEKAIAILGARSHLKNISNQLAIADIARSVAKEGTDFSENSAVEDEWLDRFMDASKFVSDEDAQHIWGNILAGEFDKPGSTPPSVTRILSELRSKYAVIFSNVCSLMVTVFFADGNGTPTGVMEHALIVPDVNAEYLSSLDITYASIAELELLGLVTYESTGFARKYSLEQAPLAHVYYGGNHFTLTQYPNLRFPVGCVRLTEAGRCIAKYTKKRIITDHLDAVNKYMASKHCVISPENKVIITENLVDDEVEYSITKI